MSKFDPKDSNEEALDPEAGNIILAMVKQFSKDMDLSRVTFPTFVLEPRSFTERVTDFMTHPDVLLDAASQENEIDRFIQVTKYYLSGWHIHPRGVKKPYNPVLGEFFRCRYSFEDDSRSFYISEQVSHHPPITAMYYNNPQHGIRINGELRPISRFFGNSVAMMLDSKSYGKIYLDSHGEEYNITYPNMYARGILFGKMFLELGEKSTVICEKSNLQCEVEFKTKGFFTGSYNQIEGKITTISEPRETLYHISGNWQTVTYIKNVKTDETTVLFDSSQESVMLKDVPKIDDQEPNESRNLWRHVTVALKNKDQDAATTEKTKIEEAQREAARTRRAQKIQWSQRFFSHDAEKDIYLPKICIDDNEIDALPSDPEEAGNILTQWIFTKPDGSIPEFVKDDESSVPC
ncbi:Oxysterol-binding protein OBPa [Mycoemilia scoparia]|uniref:Oxysterol-binding protein OBPa n=1 Tax=Mycoemilia scoparia TaxID=417184 RepID=A0A9W8A7P7_9FUNG|nr:Oxysterol-binding protein OBPa [Mycoemilia scoparia]